MADYKYTIKYKAVDYDAEERVEHFKRWTEVCKFMKRMLDDGHLIVEVAG